MPASQVELLRGFLAQDDGRLSQRALAREFAALNADEVAEVERAYALTFTG